MSSPLLWKLVPTCRTLSAILTISLLIINAQTIRTKSLGENEPRSRFECPPLPTTCLCTFVGSELEVQCPLDPRIIVRYQPGKFVQIECTKSSVQDYEHLPTMEISDIPTAQFRRCPLPQGQSLQTILNRIGVQRVRSLLFQSYGLDLGGPLKREHFRGLNDLERLVLNRNGLTELPADVFSDLRNLTWLDLSANRIHLPRDIFANLDKLDFLELGFNNLQNLEPGIFRNQQRLKHLNMWSNKLHNLTRSTFEGIPSITDLDLSANQLSSLDSDVFQPLTNLRSIHLSKNNFTTLPEGLFANNKNLEKIRLMENFKRMETLPAGFLADLPNLGDVWLKANLKQLPADMFMDSPNIVNISLANNEFESLPSELFWNQTGLENLDLSRNKLVELPGDLFAYTKSLTVLNLANNKLENITSELFANVHMLLKLYLQNNNLHHIHSRAFAGTKNLQFVNASNNWLSFADVALGFGETEAFEIGSPFQYSNELEILDLHNNSIGFIFRDWTLTLTKLRILDLSHNDINMLNINDLTFTSQNVEVNLAHNAIAEVDFGIITAISLPNRKISVKLEHNPLICNCLILHFVQYLHQGIGNELKDHLNMIPGDLQCTGPDRLKGRPVTSLGYNELLCQLDSPKSMKKSCPGKCNCQVRPVDYTLIVNCSSLGLTQVPELPEPRGLQFTELHIENNNLTKLPQRSHPGYAQVSQIHACNNNISTLLRTNIPDKLHVLDLSNNSLTWLNDTVFGAINRTNLSLGNNPWRCDCQARHLHSFVRTNYQRIKDLDAVKCSSGKKLSTLSPSELCQEDQPLLILACTVAVLGLLFGIFASLYYRYHAEIKVWLYAHNMCLWFVSEEELDKDKKYDAFISYSHKDEDFVTDHLLPNLENGPVPFKLCLHERDWVIGEYIPNQIVRSVDDSRRTIVVLSPNFLESIWGRMEFQAAHKAALTEGRARIIVIIYGDIGNTDHLDPELRAYLNMNTYVKWGDPWFWKKLRYAMPHPPSHGHTSAKGLVKSALKSSTDDKLELIKPVPVTPPPLTTPPAEQASKNPLLTKLNGNLISGSNVPYANGGGHLNGHVNGAFIINTNAKQSDV